MLISFVRALILYAVMVLAIRLMGKRQLGEMEPSEFVVAMLIADLASVPMQDIGIPLLAGVIPIITVLALEWILSSLSMRSLRMRALLCGHSIILIQDGKIQQQNLRRTRITADELLEHLRQCSVLDPQTVKYAILETNGMLSTILDPNYAPAPANAAGIPVENTELPLTVISNGRVLEKNLKMLGFDLNWLKKVTTSHGCTIETVFLMTATRSGQIYLSKKEESS